MHRFLYWRKRWKYKHIYFPSHRPKYWRFLYFLILLRCHHCLDLQANGLTLNLYAIHLNKFGKYDKYPFFSQTEKKIRRQKDTITLENNKHTVKSKPKWISECQLEKKNRVRSDSIHFKKCSFVRCVHSYVYNVNACVLFDNNINNTLMDFHTVNVKNKGTSPLTINTFSLIKENFSEPNVWQ